MSKVDMFLCGLLVGSSSVVGILGLLIEISGG
jgi:hypothetical protein